jgi:hypothetical protein
VAHGHVFGHGGSGVRRGTVFRGRVGGRVGVQGGFGFGGGGAEGRGGEGEGPGVDDLVAMRVYDLDLLAVADEGCGAATGGDGLGRGHGRVRFEVGW